MILIVTKDDRNKAHKNLKFEQLEMEDFKIPMSQFAKADSAWYVEDDRILCLKDRRHPDHGGHLKGVVKMGTIAKQALKMFSGMVGVK